MRHHQDKSDINDELHEELNKCLEINKDHPMKCINPVKYEYEQDYDSNENVEKKDNEPDDKTISRKKSPKKKVLKEHLSSEDSGSSDEGDETLAKKGIDKSAKDHSDKYEYEHEYDSNENVDGHLVNETENTIKDVLNVKEEFDSQDSKFSDIDGIVDGEKDSQDNLRHPKNRHSKNRRPKNRRPKNRRPKSRRPKNRRRQKRRRQKRRRKNRLPKNSRENVSEKSVKNSDKFENYQEDIWKTKKCERKRKRGKCNKKRVAKKCQKTCDLNQLDGIDVKNNLDESGEATGTDNHDKEDNTGQNVSNKKDIKDIGKSVNDNIDEKDIDNNKYEHEHEHDITDELLDDFTDFQEELNKFDVNEMENELDESDEATANKGLLISKCPYEKSVSSKIPTKIFLKFCPDIFGSFLGASWGLS